MADKPKGVLRAVLIAALITLVVTLVRLWGELEQWDPKIFSREPGGGGISTFVGIWVLVPIFGFWFGRRLAQNGKRPASTGRALLMCVIGAAVVAGAFYVGFVADLGWDRQTSGMAAGIGCIVGGLLFLFAWPAGYLTQLAYGILARVPVMVITYFAVDRSWDTHYAKVPPDQLPPGSSPDDALVPLLMAQATFWIFAFTVLVGGLFAVLGAATVRK
jgi:hypothetical protein